jgi:hypothetical protein
MVIKRKKNKYLIIHLYFWLNNENQIFELNDFIFFSIISGDKTSKITYLNFLFFISIFGDILQLKKCRDIMS